MTDAAALLLAVRRHPHDDLPRLAYADWLDEHGGPERAEFVRVQCELAGWRSRPGPGSEDYRRYEDLRDREKELWGSWPDENDIRSQVHAQMPKAGGDGWAILPAAWMEPGHYRGLPNAVVRRGFVDAVTLPLAAFVGGECPECHGTGDHPGVPEYQGERDPCPTCHGNRRVGGLARGLFGEHPITAVTLSCRRPGGNNEDEPHDYYEWSRSTRAADLTDPNWPDYLPPELFDHPAVSSVGRDGRRRSRHFRTTDRAMLALSAACVACGRGLADLPAFSA